MTLLLEADDLHYAYPGFSRPILDGTTCAIEAGERVALIGRNGCGKSTFLLHCNGILRPDRGHIRVTGQQMGYTRQMLTIWRRKVGLLFQHADDQVFSANVAQDISFGPLNVGISVEEARERVTQIAQVCGIAHILDRPTHALSGGERARVALAGVLVMDPMVLIADESLANLDPWMRYQVLEIFDSLAKQGRAVLLATHDLPMARVWADRMLIMEGGRIIAHGAPGDIFADAATLERTGLGIIMRYDK